MIPNAVPTPTPTKPTPQDTYAGARLGAFRGACGGALGAEAATAGAACAASTGFASGPELSGAVAGAFGSASSLRVTVFLSAEAKLTRAVAFKQPGALASTRWSPGSAGNSLSTSVFATTTPSTVRRNSAPGGAVTETVSPAILGLAASSTVWARSYALLAAGVGFAGSGSRKTLRSISVPSTSLPWLTWHSPRRLNTIAE